MKRKTRKEKIRSQIRKEQQKAYLQQMNNLVSTKENLLKEQQENKNIRTLKFYSGICNLILPYVFVGTIGIMTRFTLGHSLPFVQNPEFRYKTITLEKDEEGVIDYEEKYQKKREFVDHTDTITLYSPWTEEEEYTRIERTYWNVPYNEDIIHAILANDFDYLWENLEQDEERKVSTNVVNEENNPHIECNLSYVLRDKEIIIKETKKENDLETKRHITTVLIIATIIAFIRKFGIKAYVRDLKNINETIQECQTAIQEAEEDIKELKRRAK